MSRERVRPPLALLLSLMVVVAACATPALSGTNLGKRQAPDFTLLDGPTGETVTLSVLRGKVVVLSFLYTACPDTCPLTAEKLRVARAALGADARNVAYVAVSVAPGRDTPEAARRFLRDHRLDGAMYFLIADRAALAAVWSRYGVYAEPQGETLVGHNDAIFLIDKQGRERSLLHSDLDPEVLVRDIRALLAESRLF